MSQSAICSFFNKKQIARARTPGDEEATYIHQPHETTWVSNVR